VYPRAQQAAQILNEYFEKGAPGSTIAGRVPLVGNSLMSSDAQRMNQAAETVSSAILRLESGAAISEDEVKRYAQQFLPQVGDSPQVRQQKKATLETQLERLRAASAPSMGGAGAAGGNLGAPPPNYTGAPPATGPVGDFNLGAPIRWQDNHGERQDVQGAELDGRERSARFDRRSASRGTSPRCAPRARLNTISRRTSRSTRD
jgi:hypothetical protein